MKRPRSYLPLGYFILLLLLILDAKTALQGAKEGISLCLYTVIPSLFPLLIISLLLNSTVIGRKIPIFNKICRFCSIPSGGESLLAIGLLGGYPVGAQCIYKTFKEHKISKDTAHRMLGFCSNAGPSFIFGMCSGLFGRGCIIWILWLIHILSSLISGALLPGKKETRDIKIDTNTMPFRDALNKAVYILVEICSWIVAFRILISILARWVFFLLPNYLITIVTGVLELSNGCIALYQIDNEFVRFILISAFLSLGGFCVLMQTLSAVKELGLGMYVPGKLLQTAFSLLLSTAFTYLLFESSPFLTIMRLLCFALSCVILLTVAIYFNFTKKGVAFAKNMGYNRKKASNEVSLCYSEKNYPVPAATANLAQVSTKTKFCAPKKVLCPHPINVENSHTTRVSVFR